MFQQYSTFWVLLPSPIFNWGGGSKYVFSPLQKAEYLDLEGFFDTEFDRAGHQNTNI